MTKKPYWLEPMTLQQVERCITVMKEQGIAGADGVYRQLADTMRELEQIKAVLVGVEGAAALLNLYVSDLEKENQILLKGWGAIQGTLQQHAVQGHMRGWNIKPIPEAVAAQELWESKQTDA